MARSRKRVCLEDGLKLDLNQLVRGGVLASEARMFGRISWQVAGSREVVGVAVVTAHLVACPRIRIRMRGLDQTIDLIAQPRSFGGSQWYFRCPSLGLAASVLWRPPGGARFCSRQAWGKEVAYRTQFVGRVTRARVGSERTRARLSSNHKDAGNRLLPPPKPKWMRWATYERRIEKYYSYETVLLKDSAVRIGKLNAMLAAK
jgi:hypothetical protein